MMLHQLFTRTLLVLLGLTIAPAENLGLPIIEGGERGLGSLNPLTCVNHRCDRITKLLFPQLLNIDSDTGWLIPADETSGLVESWKIDGNVVTYGMREDKVWTDGMPITAHDVFFSYGIAIQEERYRYLIGRHISLAAPLDNHTIRFIFNNATCDVLPQANFPIIPAHVYDVHFAEKTGFAAGDTVNWYKNDKLPDSTVVLAHPERSNPTVTGGGYQLVEYNPDESIRVISTDGRMEYTNLQVGIGSATNRFLSGDTNLLVEPPYERRAELHADETSQAFFYPGHLSFFIALNLADPNSPQPAFDENRNLIQQIPHPIFSDPVVRRAMQMALDVDTMIETVLDGYGMRLASLLPPSALGFNPSLEPLAFDPMTARQLLADAGWLDTNGDGIRECLTCSTASPGTEMVIRLDYFRSGMTASLLDNAAIAQFVQERLQMVGVGVNIEAVSAYNQLSQQTFEAFLIDGRASNSGTTWLMDMFRQEYDRPQDFSEGAWNFTSYANPEFDRLLKQADYGVGCDVEMRGALYQEAEAILHAEQPALWLFSPYQMVVSRPPLELPSEFWEPFLP